MSEDKYILLAVPKSQKDDTQSVLSRKLVNDVGAALNVYKFSLPDFLVGTLDSLLSLSDELKKVDNFAESVVKRIAQALQETDEESGKKDSSQLTITCDSGNYPVPKYLGIFKWLEAKYQKRQPLKGLVAYIHSQLGKFDNEIKTKTTNFSNLQHTITSEARKTGGNLATRDFSDRVKQQQVVSSEYLESIFVAIPKYNAKEFLQAYENFLPEVVPRSALLIDEDSDFVLYRVVVLSKKANDFKNACREKKYIVREFKYTPNTNIASTIKKLNEQSEDAKNDLIRWCKANLSETFIAWIHLKCIRAFVEAVLRFGLPTDFQAVIIQPKKGKENKIREFLNNHYAYLGNKSVFAKHDVSVGGEEVVVPMDDEDMFPYVSVDINADWKKTW